MSTLSKVENDLLSLTYDKLQLLSRKLGMRMSELFAEGEDVPPQVTARRSVDQLERALHVSTPNYDYHYLCTELRQKQMIPLMMTIKAKTMEEFGEFSRHPGEEYNFVLKGPVELHTEFYDTILLEEGDSIYIDATMGHAFLVGEGCDEAMVVEVCSSSDDEDLMASLMSLHEEHQAPPPANEYEAGKLPKRPRVIRA